MFLSDAFPLIVPNEVLTVHAVAIHVSSIPQARLLHVSPNPILIVIDTVASDPHSFSLQAVRSPTQCSQPMSAGFLGLGLLPSLNSICTCDSILPAACTGTASHLIPGLRSSSLLASQVEAQVHNYLTRL